MFLGILVLVFVFRGRVYFLLVGACGAVQIVSRCFTLYFAFLALTTLVLPCWVIYVKGSIFCCFLFQTVYWFMFMSSSLIYVFIVCCLKSRFYFSLLVFFFHTCGYAFCLSVSRNIQVDSIKLLSTLTTDGQQL